MTCTIYILAPLVLKKVNKDQKALSGARFTLVNSETQESQTATSVDGTGLVNFTRLGLGTYTFQKTLHLMDMKHQMNLGL